MNVSFTAPCPDCGQPCEWWEYAADGYGVEPPVFEVRCDCWRQAAEVEGVAA